MEVKKNWIPLHWADALNTSDGEVAWRSPSNIALVKYWGKYGRQLPSNPSISFTLKNAHTNMRMKYSSGNGAVTLYFEGERNEQFEQRIKRYIESINDIYPFLENVDLEIHSDNSFPHSAGIASSASAMSALALCLCSIEKKVFNTLGADEDFFYKASFLSRLASGSACRSVYPKLAIWGEHPEIEGTSNNVANPVGSHVDPIFHTFKNSILIASAKEKSVSSSAGHQLMEDNPFAEVRFSQARSNLKSLMEAMAKGDIAKFIEIVEEEALTLHALMMTSKPSYILMQANSLILIDKVRSFREETGLPICFTLDAGPNLHVLYPFHIAKEVEGFIENECRPYCENGLIIQDEVGDGAMAI
jgi:diphosphomevalonate decarboxylase